MNTPGTTEMINVKIDEQKNENNKKERMDILEWTNSI